MAVVPRWPQACSTTKWAAQPSRLASTPSPARARWSTAVAVARRPAPGRRSTAAPAVRTSRRARGPTGLVGWPRIPGEVGCGASSHLQTRASCTCAAERTSTCRQRIASRSRYVRSSRRVRCRTRIWPTWRSSSKANSRRAVADPLGGLLAHEEVAIAADHLQQPLVLVLLGAEGLDAMQQLVVVQRQPALRRRVLVGPLVPRPPCRGVVQRFAGRDGLGRHRFVLHADYPLRYSM